MTFAQLLAAFTALMQTVNSLTATVAKHETSIALLEGKVLSHDTQIKSFPKDTPQTAPQPAPSGPGGTLTFTTAHQIPDAQPI